MNLVFKRYADIYDYMYLEKDYQSEFEYVASLIGGFENKCVLDIGCGTGRYSELFAVNATSVDGIDISQEMVEIAEQRKSNLAHELKKKLHYEVNDARNFKSDKTYDIVCSMFHVINYQSTSEALRQFFATAHDALNHRGIFVFDFWYGPGVLADKPTPRQKEIRTNFGKIVRTATPELRLNDNICDVTYDIQLENDSRPGVIELFSETHSMRFLFIPEIRDLVADKFSIINILAWQKHRAPDERDWSAVCVLMKN